VLAEPFSQKKLSTSSASTEHASKDDSSSSSQVSPTFLNNELLLQNATSDGSALISWNLEIRKFAKSDVGCYQCQLNSLQQKVVHYCLKMEGKLDFDNFFAELSYLSKTTNFCRFSL
jgi:hypothetical protein